MEEFIDQKARDMANRAISMIESHERVCVERSNAAKGWRAAADGKLDALANDINRFNGRIYSATVGLIGVLLAVIAYLISNHGL